MSLLQPHTTSIAGTVRSLRVWRSVLQRVADGALCCSVLQLRHRDVNSLSQIHSHIIAQTFGKGESRAQDLCVAV